MESVNLAGLDRVILVAQHPDTKRLLFRQYSVRYKKSGEAAARAGSRGGRALQQERAAVARVAGLRACVLPGRPGSPAQHRALTACAAGWHRSNPLPSAGTRVPRTELTEMGPSLDLEVRRSRQPPPDLEKEACRRPKLDKKKVGAGGWRVLAGGGMLCASTCGCCTLLGALGTLRQLLRQPTAARQ